MQLKISYNALTDDKIRIIVVDTEVTIIESSYSLTLETLYCLSFIFNEKKLIILTVGNLESY